MAETYNHFAVVDLTPIVRIIIYIIKTAASDEVSTSDTVIANVVSRVVEEIGHSDEPYSELHEKDAVVLFDGVNAFVTIGQKTIHITDPRYFKQKNA